jgi:hypothetical protein
MNAFLSLIAAKTTGYRMLLAGAVAASALAIGSTAHAGVRVAFGFSFGVPVVVAAPVYSPPPVCYQPAPVYTPAPATVYAPAYPQPAYTPAPLPAYAPPVYTAPAYCPPPVPAFRPVFRPVYHPIYRPIYRPMFRPVFHPAFGRFDRDGWNGNRWNHGHDFNHWQGGNRNFHGGWGHH